VKGKGIGLWESSR